MIGWRYSFNELRRRPGRSLLTLFSVTIAVAAVVAVMSATDSTRAAYRQVFEALAGRADLEIVARGGGSFSREAVEAVRRLPELRALAPLFRRATVLYAHGKKAKLLAMGVDRDEPESVAGFGVTAGALPAAAGEIALDESFARSLGVAIGDDVRLLTSRGLKTQQVVGLVTLTGGGRMHQGGLLLAPLERLQQFFRATDQIDAERLYLHKPQDAARVIAAARPLLPESLEVRVPSTRNGPVEEMLALVEFSLQIASAMAFLTAVFIALSVFLMNVGERRRQLSIMRAIGATRGQVLGMICFESLLVGILGTCLGAPLGVVGGTLLLGGTSQLLGVESPATPSLWWALAVGAAVGPIVCLCGGGYPALKASRVSPLEGMRPAVTLERQARHGLLALLGLAGIVLAAVAAVVSVRNGGPLWVAVGSIVLLLGSIVLLLPVALAPSVWLFLRPWRRFGWVETELSQRFVLRHNDRSSLTAGVLFMAVAASVAISNAVFNVTYDIRSWQARTMTADYMIRTMMPDMSGQDPGAMPETLADELSSRPDVESVEGVSILRVDIGGHEAILCGRDFARLAQAPLNVSADAEQGLVEALARGEVVLGSVIAELAGVKAGETVAINAGEQTRQARVAALANDYLSGGSVAYMDRDVANRLFQTQGLDTLLVKAKREPDPALRKDLEAFVSRHGLILQSFAELRQVLDQMVSGVSAGLWVMLAVGLMVGAFGVVNTLTMNVLEQTRELGMLRAIGMERRQVLRTVLAQAALIGLIGVTFGGAIGLTLSRTINLSMGELFGRHVAYALRPEVVGLVAILALAEVLAAATFPALRAAALNPIRAMRQE